MNSTDRLKNFEKHRGDNYFLVRRMSEIIMRDQVQGPPISSNAGACAFGQWQKRFESGSDPLAGNDVFRQAIENMKPSHADFHAAASL